MSLKVWRTTKPQLGKMTANTKQLITLTPEQRGKIDTLTNIQSIIKQGNTNIDIKDLKDEIYKQTGGPQELAKLTQSGKPITKQDLLSIQTKIAPQQQPYRAAEKQMELATERIQASQAATALAARQEFNQNQINLAEIDFKNKTNDYNYRTANLDREYKYKSEEKDRELKALLTELGYADKRDERALDREERRQENRQMMILQLMKGLGNLGGAFAN